MGSTSVVQQREAPISGDEFGRGTGFVLGGQPLPLTVPAQIYVCGITPYDVTHVGTPRRSSGQTSGPVVTQLRWPFGHW